MGFFLPHRSRRVFARAKRGRVVENEYEKANRRPDTATLKARTKRNAEMPKGWSQNRSSTFFKRPTSYLKLDPDPDPDPGLDPDPDPADPETQKSHTRFARATVAGLPGSNRPATLFIEKLEG